MSVLDVQIKAIKVRNNLFGPPYTEAEITWLRTRADVEGWSDWLAQIESMRSRRKRRWMLRYVLMGAVFVAKSPNQDPYEDDDPFELDV